MLKYLLRFAFVFFLFSQQFSFAQLVGGAGVYANFGVEADAYENRLQFPDNNGNLLTTPNTDDWFVNTALYPGAGLGVIDQSLPFPLVGNNAFERRQSITTPTFPFPYPVVNGDLWIDAVYGRDTYSAQGNTDLTIFFGNIRQEFRQSKYLEPRFR